MATRSFVLVATLLNTAFLSAALAQGTGVAPKTTSIKNKTLRLSELSSLNIRYDGSESKVSSVTTKVQATVSDSSDVEIKAAVSGGATVIFYDMDYPNGTQARRVFEGCMRAIEGARPKDSVRLTGDFEILPKVNKIFVRKVRACQVAAAAGVSQPANSSGGSPANPTTAQPAKSYLPGDLNKDGAVDILDAADFNNVCGGNADPAKRPTECDINGDGQYNQADVDLFLANYK